MAIWLLVALVDGFWPGADRSPPAAVHGGALPRHHVRAATADDAASARHGESLWRFLPRTVVGKTVNACRLEAKRLRDHRRGWMSSPFVWSWGFDVGVIVLLIALAQWKALESNSLLWFRVMQARIGTTA